MFQFSVSSAAGVSSVEASTVFFKCRVSAALQLQPQITSFSLAFSSFQSLSL
jgi:hypothetical protein